MNFRRGFLRLWVFVSLTWIVGWGLVGLPTIKSAVSYWTGSSLVFVYVNSDNGEKELSFPLSTSPDQITSAVETLRAELIKAAQSETGFPDLRPKTPSQKTSPSTKSVRHLTEKLQLDLEKRNALWKARARLAVADFSKRKEVLKNEADFVSLLGVLTFIFSVPLFFLAIGTTVGWVLRGFRST